MRQIKVLALSSLILCSAFADEALNPDKQILYKTVGDTELRLHVFKPEDSQPSDNRPAIVFFFGAGCKHPQIASYLLGGL